MKNQILELRKQGKTYDEIVAIVGCRKSTVSWHCSEKSKETARRYRRNSRRTFITELKNAHGGKCSKCGYDKCLDALHFHHKDPKTKLMCVSRIVVELTQKAATLEAEKCILICANCHAELHCVRPTKVDTII